MGWKYLERRTKVERSLLHHSIAATTTRLLITPRSIGHLHSLLESNTLILSILSSSSYVQPRCLVTEFQPLLLILSHAPLKGWNHVMCSATATVQWDGMRKLCGMMRLMASLITEQIHDKPLHVLSYQCNLNHSFICFINFLSSLYLRNSYFLMNISIFICSRYKIGMYVHENNNYFANIRMKGN